MPVAAVRHIASAHVTASYIAMAALLCCANAAGDPFGNLPFLTLAAPVTFPAIVVVGLLRPDLALVGHALLLLCYVPAGCFLLAWLLHRHARVERSRGGLRLAWGYNLTGNTSGVCPECGTPTSAGVKA